ncbi:SOS response-associated peptidase [soil metagenome]
MCGRFVVKGSAEEFGRKFNLNQIRLTFAPRYNVAPSTNIPVIRNLAGQRVMDGLRWGLRPFWAKPDAKLPLMINARAETVTSKPAFRAAYKTRRCIIPASGYYEWQKLPGGLKQPFYITRADSQPIPFAGLWEEAHGEEPPTAAIITSDANPDTSHVHDRMPVILPDGDWPQWLAPEPLGDAETARLLASAPPGSLVSYPVSTAVNAVRNDGPQLIEPIDGPFPTRPAP